MDGLSAALMYRLIPNPCDILSKIFEVKAAPELCLNAYGNECVPIIRSSIALAVVGASADATAIISVYRL